MKKFIFSLLISSLGFSLFAADNGSLFEQANNAYKKSEYNAAISLYNSILKTGYEASDVYFNLGNAYYKKKDIANAILNYERAHRLNPGNDDINFNLQLSQTMIVDKINSLPEFIMFKWWRNFSEFLSSNSWAWASILFFILALISVAVYLFTRLRWLKISSFWIATVFTFFSLMSFIHSYQIKSLNESHTYAIVMSASVTLKSSPVDNGNDLFVLHEGTKVTIMDAVGEWLKIKIADGNNGWLKKSDIEEI
jgi:tetratricopeptide (TPR) repeat protein